MKALSADPHLPRPVDVIHAPRGILGRANHDGDVPDAMKAQLGHTEQKHLGAVT